MTAAGGNGVWDVAIIGGGPGGSTLGSLLKKYAPDLRVVILEKESFPRDHVGESQLPPIGAILHEMGAWEKVERAGFPVKIGATYTWGKTVDPWVFEFLPVEQIPAEPGRPGMYKGWRQQTAFQVDRAVYDKVLLDHAREMGCAVREATRVATIRREGDRVVGLELADGGSVEAERYVDASGAAAILRRAMGVEVEAPTLLRNVSFWEYWEKASWADEPDVSVTRVHIRSLPYGWLWCIRLSPTRYSVGLVCPADHYKKSGKRPAELYMQSVRDEKFVAKILEGAAARGKIESTTDWSFVVDRTYGDNWFLVGEVAGFADPILAAGLTLTQSGARELAYTILELERGEHDRAWLLGRYDELQKRRVRQHMRFAEYWYSANGMFEEIRENCVEIARDAGLRLSPAEAFRWLSQGGLGDDYPGQVGVGGLDVAAVKQIMERFTGGKAAWTISGKNTFKLNMNGATESTIGVLENGRIRRAACWERAGRRLAELGIQGEVIRALRQTSDAESIMRALRASLGRDATPEHLAVWINQAMQVLEVMTNDYWVIASSKKGRPALNIETPAEGAQIHSQRSDGAA